MKKSLASVLGMGILSFSLSSIDNRGYSDVFETKDGKKIAIDVRTSEFPNGPRRSNQVNKPKVIADVYTSENWPYGPTADNRPNSENMFQKGLEPLVNQDAKGPVIIEPIGTKVFTINNPTNNLRFDTDNKLFKINKPSIIDNLEIGSLSPTSDESDCYILTGETSINRVQQMNDGNFPSYICLTEDKLITGCSTGHGPSILFLKGNPYINVRDNEILVLQAVARNHRDISTNLQEKTMKSRIELIRRGYNKLTEINIFGPFDMFTGNLYMSYVPLNDNMNESGIRKKQNVGKISFNSAIEERKNIDFSMFDAPSESFRLRIRNYDGSDIEQIIINNGQAIVEKVDYGMIVTKKEIYVGIKD